MPETLEKTVLPAANPVTQVLRQKLADGGTIARFPDGTEALVIPMNCLEELVTAMRSADFQETLAASISDYKAGNVDLLAD